MNKKKYPDNKKGKNEASDVHEWVGGSGIESVRASESESKSESKSESDQDEEHKEVVPRVQFERCGAGVIRRLKTLGLPVPLPTVTTPTGVRAFCTIWDSYVVPLLKSVVKLPVWDASHPAAGPFFRIVVTEKQTHAPTLYLRSQLPVKTKHKLGIGNKQTMTKVTRKEVIYYLKKVFAMDIPADMGKKLMACVSIPWLVYALHKLGPGVINPVLKTGGEYLSVPGMITYYSSNKRTVETEPLTEEEAKEALRMLRNDGVGEETQSGKAVAKAVNGSVVVGKKKNNDGALVYATKLAMLQSEALKRKLEISDQRTEKAENELQIQRHNVEAAGSWEYKEKILVSRQRTATALERPRIDTLLEAVRKITHEEKHLKALSQHTMNWLLQTAGAGQGPLSVALGIRPFFATTRKEDEVRNNKINASKERSVKAITAYNELSEEDKKYTALPTITTYRNFDRLGYPAAALPDILRKFSGMHYASGNNVPIDAVVNAMSGRQHSEADTVLVNDFNRKASENTKELVRCLVNHRDLEKIESISDPKNLIELSNFIEQSTVRLDAIHRLACKVNNEKEHPGGQQVYQEDTAEQN
jgi:hypothetical protein